MKTRKRFVSHLFGMLLAALLLCTACMTVLAAPGLDPDALGSVTLTMQDNGTAATDGELAVYRVLDLDDSSWKLTEAFAGCGESLDDLESADLAKALADYAAEQGIKTTATAEVENGAVTFADLSVGGYLVVQSVESTGFYAINPFLVTVPLKEGESWIYDVDGTPKAQVELIPEESETEAETESETGSTDTGAADQTTAEAETEEETEAETEEEAEEETETGSIIAAGTGSGSSSGSGTLPQTGQLNWPIPVLTILGALLFAVGIVLQRKKPSAA